MPWRTTRERIQPMCLRCGEEIRDAKRNRKWCRACRIWARLGNALRTTLRELDHVHGPGVEEGRAAIADLREQLNVGEDLFPLDGAMSTAEFALRRTGGPIPREAWPELRAAAWERGAMSAIVRRWPAARRKGSECIALRRPILYSPKRLS